MSKTVFAIKECPDFVFYNRDWNKVIVDGSMEEAKEELAEQMYEDNPDSVLSDKDRIYEASGMIGCSLRNRFSRQQIKGRLGRSSMDS